MRCLAVGDDVVPVRAARYIHVRDRFGSGHRSAKDSMFAQASSLEYGLGI
jgi:hypothetical protein